MPTLMPCKAVCNEKLSYLRSLINLSTACSMMSLFLLPSPKNPSGMTLSTTALANADTSTAVDAKSVNFVAGPAPLSPVVALLSGAAVTESAILCVARELVSSVDEGHGPINTADLFCTPGSHSYARF